MLVAVLFDADGTLFDSAEFILNSYEYTCRTLNLPMITREMLNDSKGIPLRETYDLYHPEGTQEESCRVHKDFQLQNLHLCKPFADTRDTLDKLKERDVRMGIVSARGGTVHPVVELNGLTSYFEVIVTADDVVLRKPHAEGLLLALDKMQVKPEHAFMVGDMHGDIEMGRRAGVKTIGVACGFEGWDRLKTYNPTYLAQNLGDIISPIDLHRGLP
ncbi:MAG TPA: HAD-IA family hydrolase [Verrucomicrobiae bacterium]|nr:HAD-IA family hydrolase [Verrucomicrobiae bacterium]